MVKNWADYHINRGSKLAPQCTPRFAGKDGVAIHLGVNGGTMEGQSETQALSQATPIRGHVTLSFYATTGCQTTPTPSHKMKELSDLVAYFDGKLTGVWTCSFETTKTSIVSKASPGPVPPSQPPSSSCSYWSHPPGLHTAAPPAPRDSASRES